MSQPAGSLTVKQAADALDMGSRELFAFLRAQHIIDGRNQPYLTYISAGYLESRPRIWIHPEHGEQHYTRTYITPHGLAWLRKVIQGATAHQPGA